MNIEREEAERQLAEIAQRQLSAVERLLIPAWYWFVAALGIVTVGFVADTGSAALIVATALIFVAIIATATFEVIFGIWSGARVRDQVLGDQGSVSISVFVFVALGASLATAFGSRALGFAYPGTLGTIAGALVLVVGGPRLTRRLRRIMLANARDLR
jgi:hypothetical protein